MDSVENRASNAGVSVLWVDVESGTYTTAIIENVLDIIEPDWLNLFTSEGPEQSFHAPLNRFQGPVVTPQVLP